MIAFLVVSAAVVVLTRGLLKKRDATVGGAADPTTPMAVGRSADPLASATVVSGRSRPGPTDPARCASEFEAISSVKELAAGNEVVFILLPGDVRTRAEEAAQQLRAAEKTIRKRGRSVASVTFDKHAEGRAGLLERYGVASLPCVIALGKDCGSATVSGEISEAALLKAFVVASTPASACGSTCAGKSNCGAAGDE